MGKISKSGWVVFGGIVGAVGLVIVLLWILMTVVLWMVGEKSGRLFQ